MALGITDIVTIVISLLALLVGYITYRSGKQTAEEASKLAFQTAKNELRTEVNKQGIANQRRSQNVLAALQEFRAVAEQVEALDLPELSDQAGAFKVDMLHAFDEFESQDAQPELDSISAELDDLPAEMATAGSVRQLEAAKGHLQQMILLSDDLEKHAAGIVSSLQEATKFYRDLLERFAEDDAEELTEEQEENDTDEPTEEGEGKQ